MPLETVLRYLATVLRRAESSLPARRGENQQVHREKTRILGPRFAAPILSTEATGLREALLASMSRGSCRLRGPHPCGGGSET